jgi:hypothetical protein
MPILELHGFLQLHGLGDITTASSALKSAKTELRMRVSVSCALSKVMILSSSMCTWAEKFCPSGLSRIFPPHLELAFYVLCHLMLELWILDCVYQH